MTSVIHTVRGLIARPAVWLAIAAYVIFVRLPSLPPSSIDPDESMFILMGRELLHGRLPYVDIFDNKPFGIPALFALALAIFGQSVVAARLLGTACVIATALLLRAIALTIGLQQAPAFAVAILYAAFSTQVDGLATTSEILLAPFTAAAVFVLARNMHGEQTVQRRAAAMSLAGIWFGLALWIKYVPAVTAAALFGGLVLTWLVCRKISFVGACILALVFGMACVLPTALTGIFYTLSGHWVDFWYANFGYMPAYVGQPALMQGIKIVAEQAVMQLWPLLGLAAAGVVVALMPRVSEGGIDRAGAIGAVLWLVAEVIASIAPMHFFDHYFLLLLPPLALLAGLALQYATIHWIQSGARHAAAPIIAICIGFMPIMDVVHSMTRDWLNLGEPDAIRRIAALIRSDSDPHPTLWIASTAPIIIYFEAGLPLPTRYPFASHLVSRQHWLTAMDSTAEIQRLLHERPTFLVIDRHNWQEVRSDVQPIIGEALARDYRLVGTASGGKHELELYRVTS
jgi:Dolichyl-phosphate-mannose-protein mannosyltransferase